MTHPCCAKIGPGKGNESMFCCHQMTVWCEISKLCNLASNTHSEALAGNITYVQPEVPGRQKREMQLPRRMQILRVRPETFTASPCLQGRSSSSSYSLSSCLQEQSLHVTCHCNWHLRANTLWIPQYLLLPICIASIQYMYRPVCPENGHPAN